MEDANIKEAAASTVMHGVLMALITRTALSDPEGVKAQYSVLRKSYLKTPPDDSHTPPDAFRAALLAELDNLFAPARDAIGGGDWGG